MSRTEPDRSSSEADAWAVILDRTPRGTSELQRRLFPLNAMQRTLLGALDGCRSLRELAGGEPGLAAARLTHDAARLLAFGLVKQVRGELPRDAVVAAMNLTVRVPAAAYGDLAARHAGQPQDEAEPGADAAAAPAAHGRRLAAALALALVALAAAAVWWPR